MNKYLQLLREIKSVSMATVDEYNYPQVRIIDVMLVKNDELYFCTARGKDFHKQLISTKKISIVGLSKKYEMVKLTGDVIHLMDDENIIDEIFDNNPMMNELYKEDSRYILEGFCVKDALIEFFDLSSLPIDRKTTTIGNFKIKSKIYKITKNCIQCGKCYSICPQNCISDELEINQSRCLRCGYCFENCPVEAIGCVEND
ncbi:MAG: 4Fe-4S binding protein [bacterium]